MAKFKLYLMSLRGVENEFAPQYSLIPISEFDTEYNQYDGIQQLTDQNIDGDIFANNKGAKTASGTYTKSETAHFNQNQLFAYTSNEKFQIHQNSQRNLTFTMHRNIIRADRVDVNPFIHYLFIGAQLLLVDKYDNHHLMTVSKISYDFTSLNTEFSYECQDSFSYQLTRQNSGYSIENTISSNTSEFIGAQSLDWWVLCKIHPECKISYRYLKLSDHMKFTDSSVVKQAYIGPQYEDYYRTVPFSGSGTANSILIALGELYGLQLQVYERVDLQSTILQGSEEIDNPNYGRCEKYYGFVPSKSLRPTGLRYSPYYDLKNFTLEHSGNSFASVLNIQSNTIGEDIITVIPSVPNFFRQGFETEDWGNSYFIPGLFSSACQEYVEYKDFNFTAVVNLSDLTSDFACESILYENQYIYIPVNIKKGCVQYDFIQFTTVGRLISELMINMRDGDEEISSIYRPNHNNGEIIYKIKTEEQEIAGPNITKIPYDKINKKGLDYFYIKLYVGSSIPGSITGKLYISQYRIPSTEELEFAKIADQLPGLENKLISFDYFYDHSIINKAEHASLMSQLENDLRKANAKLLLQTQSYYSAMQKRTEILSDLSSKIDLVGAIFHSDILSAFLDDSKSLKTTDFTLAMSDLLSNSTKSSLLLSYYATLTDYVNKYFNAEQTFLKNIMLFYDYFNSKANLGKLYTYNFTLPNQNNLDKQISFQESIGYLSLNKSNSHYPIYELIDGNYEAYLKDNIVTADNLNRFCFSVTDDSTMERIDSEAVQYQKFNTKQQYFELAGEVEIYSIDNGGPTQDGEDLQSIIIKQDSHWFTIELAENSIEIGSKAVLSCYMSCLHTTQLSKDQFVSGICTFINNGTEQSSTIKVKINGNIYKPVNYTNICNNFFYNQFNITNTNNRKLRSIHRRLKDSRGMICQVKMNTSGVDSFNNLGISPKTCLSFANSKNWSAERINALQNEDMNVADEVYKESFPITSIYGKEGDQYHSVPFVNIENCQQFYRRTSTPIMEHQKQTGISINESLVSMGQDNFTGFNNIGGTSKDIFNCDAPVFNDGGSTSTRFMYVVNATSYQNTSKKAIFDSNCFDEFGAGKGGLDYVYNKGYNEDDDLAVVSTGKLAEAKNIPLTYYSFTRRLPDHIKEKYYYSTKYGRILKSTDIVDNIKNIEIITYGIKLNKGNKTDFITNSFPLTNDGGNSMVNRLNSIMYYPLQNTMWTQNLSELKWPSNPTNVTLGALLAQNGFSNDSTNGISDNEVGQGTIDGTDGQLMFVTVEDYDYEDISDLSGANVGYEKLAQYVAAQYYDNLTYASVDLITKYPELTNGFYVNKPDKDVFVSASTFDDSKVYYEKVGDTYERRYTLNQLINKKTFYVQTYSRYSYVCFGEINKLNIQYFVYDPLNKNTSMENGLISIDKENWTLTGPSILTPIVLDDLIEWKDLNDCTNGGFGYTHQNSIDSTSIMEKVMLIETNLTEYGTNAYYASKNCKFFLPQYGQPTIDHKTNYFSNQILSIRTINNEVTDVQLLPTFIPQVDKITNQPTYQFKHRQIVDNTQLTYAIQYELSTNSDVSISSMNNQTIQQMFNYLRLDVNKGIATKLSNTEGTIYIHKQDGMLGKDALNKFTNYAIQYDQFGGGYDMMINVLQLCNYQEYELRGYVQAQQDRDAVGSQIYKKYPNLIYEQSYTNQDATTSQELLLMAQGAFKDYTQPESNYNISIIDINTLKGYKGQELIIGDGIEVNAAELYDDAGSDIYKSLVQYLYITDISYNLRQDDDIQLTVNSIKYRDKVIGELVKLIR